MKSSIPETQLSSDFLVRKRNKTFRQFNFAGRPPFCQTVQKDGVEVLNHDISGIFSSTVLLFFSRGFCFKNSRRISIDTAGKEGIKIRWLTKFKGDTSKKSEGIAPQSRSILQTFVWWWTRTHPPTIQISVLNCISTTWERHCRDIWFRWHTVCRAYVKFYKSSTDSVELNAFSAPNYWKLAYQIDSEAALLPFLIHQLGSVHEWSGIWTEPYATLRSHIVR